MSALLPSQVPAVFGNTELGCAKKETAAALLILALQDAGDSFESSVRFSAISKIVDEEGHRLHPLVLSVCQIFGKDVAIALVDLEAEGYLRIERNERAREAVISVNQKMIDFYAKYAH